MDGDALSPRTEAINKKLHDLTPIEAAEQPCIFKVHEQLLKVNKEAYKPVLLAIGPYNDHATVGQGIMEKHKLRYLKQMLGRSTEHSLKDYIEALRKLEDRARKCYADAECISQNTDEFVEMMLLDGCFITELLHKWEMPDLRDEHDPIFRLGWMFAGITRDLMLFENQLPYFVLDKLFEMSASNQTRDTEPSGHSGEHSCEIFLLEGSSSTNQSVQTRLYNLATSFFSVLFPFRDWDVNGSSSYSTKNIKHLLGQTHTTITPTLAKLVHEHLKVGDKFKKVEFKHLLDLIYTSIELSVLDMEVDRAIEHQQVGVLEKIFGLTRGVVSPLLEKPEKMKGYEKINKNDCGNEDDDWNSIRLPYGKELREAGVEFETAKKFTDKFEENNRWELSIPYSIAFQEAGIEFNEAISIFRDPLVQNRNDDDKSELFGAKSKMVGKFMSLLCLNKIENWDSIPSGTNSNLRKAGVEFKKAKKFWETKDMMKPIPNATEVREAGVKFKAKNRTMFAINFCNGVLEISPLRIDDHTETFLQNLIAHEQCSPYIDSNYVTDYVRIFDDLIDSPRDVKLLRRKGVIENFLGTDEIASAMINKLCSQVMFSTINSIYDKTSIDMNSHCTNSWNVWMAMLWHKYFDSPWALISASAAFLLLVLAIILTIYTI